MPYHLNPETGEPGICRARVKPCPFGVPSEHYDTVEQAREAYEQLMGGEGRVLLSSLLSPKGSTLSSPADLTAFTRECYEEGEAFRAQFPMTDSTRWAIRDIPYGLRWYTTGGYDTINPYLRGLDVNPWDKKLDPEVVEMAKDRIKTIDSLFDTVEEKPRVVYRFASTQNRTVKETLEAIAAEGQYYEPAYTSTSASHEYPLYKAMEEPGQHFLMEIATNKALPLQEDEEARQSDIQSCEHELLLPRGARFEVAGIEWRKRCELGELKTKLLPYLEWKDNEAERRIRKADHFTVPVIKLVQVASDG